MSVTYTVLLMDEFDWNYADKSKSEYIQKIEVELQGIQPIIRLEAEFYRHLVFELDRFSPLNREIGTVLLKSADAVFYWSDIAPWDKIQLNIRDLYK